MVKGAGRVGGHCHALLHCTRAGSCKGSGRRGQFSPARALKSRESVRGVRALGLLKCMFAKECKQTCVPVLAVSMSCLRRSGSKPKSAVKVWALPTPSCR